MKINLRKGIPLLCLSATMLLGMNQASAFTSMGRTIVSECEILGFPLLAEYANDTCDAACHRNSQGDSAYSSGNWEYFCPEPIAQGPICTDADNDGYYAEGSECDTLADFNDNNASAYPGATENCTDGIDNDGDGYTDAQDSSCVIAPVCNDLDNDGYYAEGSECGTLADFNDNNASAYPGATENCTDGIDNDGDGYTDGQDSSCVIEPVCTDLDNDTYYADGGTCGPMDCNDNDASINPGAEESCSDGIDNNCNGMIDTADQNAVDCPTACTDNDGDGSSTDGGDCGAMDCNDTNATVNPAALEICDDGIDNNCNNLSDAADSVCQTNDNGDDDQDGKPWWRKRSRDRDDNYPRWNRRSRDDSDDDDDDSDNDNSNESSDDESSSRSRSRRVWSYSRRNQNRDDD